MTVQFSEFQNQLDYFNDVSPNDALDMYNDYLFADNNSISSEKSVEVDVMNAYSAINATLKAIDALLEDY
jgi:hypothetical protein